LTAASPRARAAGLSELGRPSADDGTLVHRLIDRCPPLEPNSLYCNLLQCTHFADTCVIARQGGEAVGFLSAYLPPTRPDAVFVWQVAVGPQARKQGLGGAMLMELLARPACARVRYLLSTITESNQPSWSLFEALARRLGAGLERKPLFDRMRHLDDKADSETLVTIGPFEPVR